MSSYIEIEGWSGDDPTDATVRLAKLFRLPKDQVAVILAGIRKGQSWRFERQVSSEQGEKARLFLERLGFQVSLHPAVEPQLPPIMERGTPEELTSPVEPTQKKSLFGFLKRKPKPVVEETPAPPPPHPPVAAEEDTSARSQRSARAFALFLLFLIVLALAAPYWFGIQTQRLYEFQASKLAERGIHYQIRNYERGWLSSTIDFSARIPSSFLTLNLEGTDHVVHGPVDYMKWMEGNFDMNLFQARMHSDVNAAMQPAGMAATKLPPMSAQTTVPFAGEAELEMTAPRVSTTIYEDMEVDWNGIRGHFYVTPEFDQIHGDLQSGPLKLEQEKNKMSVQASGLGYSFNLALGNHLVPLGTVATDMQEARVNLGDDQFHINTLKLEKINRMEGGKLTSLVDMRVGRVTLPEGQFGPVEIKMASRNLNAAVLNEIQKLSLQQAPLKDPAKALPQVQDQLLGLFAQLAQGVPVFELSSLKWVSDNGTLTASASLKIDGSQTDLAKNPMMVLSVIESGGWMSIPKPLLQTLMSGGKGTDILGKKPARVSPDKKKKAEKMIQTLLKEGYLEPDGEENYKVAFAYAKGIATVNGKPLDQLKSVMMPR